MDLIQKKQVYELVYDKLKDMITDGHFQEGDYLPPEHELAEQFGVSRSAIREAMLLLRRSGIVHISPGKGTLVKKTVFPSIGEPIIDIINRDRENILELLELRKGIETEAADLAARRASKQGIARLRKAYQNLENDVNNNNLGAEADYNFHVLISEITGNKLYLQVMSSISDILKDAISKTRQETLTRPSGPKMILKQHENILKAIESRDSQKAREAMTEHLETMIAKVKSIL
ncbi:MAG: FadR/GntR family transcriptional regulator [Bacillota bacterium]